MDSNVKPDHYALGRSERETRRLILQHQIYGPVTRRFFEAAGIGAGMKVLDIGSGAGDVAILLADLVFNGAAANAVFVSTRASETPWNAPVALNTPQRRRPIQPSACAIHACCQSA